MLLAVDLFRTCVLDQISKKWIVLGKKLGHPESSHMICVEISEPPSSRVVFLRPAAFFMDIHMLTATKPPGYQLSRATEEFSLK